MPSTTLRHAYEFFRANAGYVVGRHAQGALQLARAEQAAQSAGVVFVWDADNDADWSWLEQTEEDGSYLFSEAEREGPHEVTECRAIVPCPIHRADCNHAEVLAALGGIFDATTEYRRVIEAELALESLDRINDILAREFYSSVNG